MSNLRTKISRARILPKGIELAKHIHDKINLRFMHKVECASSAMDCDWTCTSEYWNKEYANLPKVEKNGPFNTNLIVKSIRPWG